MSTLPSKRPKVDNVLTTTHLLDIPDEILEMICLKLPVHDVQWNVAFVCKRFLKISRFPGMVKDLTLTLRNMTCEEEMSKCLTKVKSALACHPNLTLNPHHFLNLVYIADTCTIIPNHINHKPPTPVTSNEFQVKLIL